MLCKYTLRKLILSVRHDREDAEALVDGSDDWAQFWYLEPEPCGAGYAADSA